ncbi:hypothetical protein [Streptomyces sp. 769]|uniref:hypothetical protein n=1 Tax=Streptomyces sp. 769 TaxID=1262452 RepID=UPI00057ED6BA|nr:hypothetical protein [Streptomyces sp. 769]AJC55060.1 hypothetical protein GZL_02469 [Streptomyces sp. 769]
MTDDQSPLASFARHLADRLPGTWSSSYHRHASPRDQADLGQRVWDIGTVLWAVTEISLEQDAVLTGPDEQQLFIVHRPHHPRQFLIAPLAPGGFADHHFEEAAEPNGIAVSDDPARAAAAVTRRLLPRYAGALDALRTAAARPDPPPGPAQIPGVVQLSWNADGTVTTPMSHVPVDVRHVFFLHGFQYRPTRGNFVLPAYGHSAQALRIQAVASHLGDRGIGVRLRNVPDNAPALPPARQPKYLPSPGRPRR